MIDYEFLKIVWWVLVGVLLIGFAVTDGFDMGVTSLLKVVGKNDVERRVMLNTVGPHWDGNQVWFITAGGAIFAAWPVVYSVSFSGLYWALLLVLFALFFRPVGFEYRSKMEDARWRSLWDWGLTIGGFVPALVFGVAFGNLLQGVPFELDAYMRSTYHGSFFALLNPYAVLCGLVSVAMLLAHGANFLQMRTEGDVLARSRSASVILSLATIVLFILAGVWLYFGIDGYVITQQGDVGGNLMPTGKTVEVVAGAWFNNYANYPITILAPVVGIAGMALSWLMSRGNRAGLAFLGSSLGMAGIILTAAVSMFPFLMPSTTNPNHSLTMWDVTSSNLTLQVMLIVALIFVPIVLAYTIWGYYKMWGRVTNAAIDENKFSAY